MFGIVFEDVLKTSYLTEAFFENLKNFRSYSQGSLSSRNPLNVLLRHSLRKLKFCNEEQDFSDNVGKFHILFESFFSGTVTGSAVPNFQKTERLCFGSFSKLRFASVHIFQQMKYQLTDNI